MAAEPHRTKRDPDRRHCFAFNGSDANVELRMVPPSAGKLLYLRRKVPPTSVELTSSLHVNVHAAEELKALHRLQLVGGTQAQIGVV